MESIFYSEILQLEFLLIFLYETHSIILISNKFLF